jgi:type IV pilus assembly protein PilN
MIRLNLLPHREMRRERRKRDFYGLMGLTSILALAGIAAVWLVFTKQLDVQIERNAYIAAKNTELDKDISEIKTLEAEVAALKARQKAVEDLQADRTIPVHLLDELVKHTPEGIFVKTYRQEAGKITLSGVAQTNEKVSELLRNLAYQTAWLEKPQLIETKSTPLDPKNLKDPRKIFEFGITALIKGRAPAGTEPGAPGAPGTPAKPKQGA